jgi:hypothetical protein
MSSRKLPTTVAAIVPACVPAAIPNNTEYVGKKVYGRHGSEFENVAGEITGTSLCRLEGCGGTRLHVKWPDGQRTYPCAKGCLVQADGSLRIR